MSGKGEPGTILSIERAAERLGGLSVSTLRNWIRMGRLTRVKVGRRTMVYETELLALIKPEQKAAKP